MTPTRLEWPPGPPPATDGLRTAFRAADRRRARTVVTAAVPVIVAAALAMTTTMQAGGTDSLQLPPAKHVTVTTSDRQVPDPPGVDVPLVANPMPQLAPATPASAAGGQAGERDSQPAVAAPALAPKPAAAGSLDVSAERSARVQVRLAKATHPAFSDAVFSRSGRYAGLWVLDSRGVVIGSALELVGTNGNPARRYSDTPTVLPAGTYTFYVVGEGPTEAHIPLRSGEKGVKTTATRTVPASYLTKSYTLQPVETTVVLRMHLPTTTAVGYVGGFISTPAPGTAASSVSVCLPHRDSACAPGDPQTTKNSQLNVGGGYGSTFDATPALLRQRRDVLLDTEAHGTGSTEMTCWSFTVALS